MNDAITFTKNIRVGLFGGEGFILGRLHGSGRAFAHADGTVVKKDLACGRLLVDTGGMVGITRAGNLKSTIFGRDGLFLADLGTSSATGRSARTKDRSRAAWATSSCEAGGRILHGLAGCFP